MEFTEVKDIREVARLGKYVASGTTAHCFKISDNEIVKVYRETSRKRALFRYNDMFKHLEFCGSISNDSFIGPNEVFYRGSQVLGYTMPYIKGRTVGNMKRNVDVKTLLEQYKKLREDTLKVVDAKYRIQDMHDRNIMYSPELGFKVIDLDGGSFYKLNLMNCLKDYNLYTLKMTILKAILKVPDYKDIRSDNYELEKLLLSYEDNFYELIDELVDKLSKEENPKIKTLAANKRKILYTPNHIDYYD